MPAPNCKCGILAAKRTVYKNGPNKGRKFYGCSRYGSGEECKFFQWAAEDEDVAPPRSNPGFMASLRERANEIFSQRYGSSNILTPPRSNTGTAPITPASNRTHPRQSQHQAEPALEVTLSIASSYSLAMTFRYNQEFIDFLKTLPPQLRGRWDPDGKQWLFAIGIHDRLVQALQQTAPIPVQVHPIPNNVRNTLLKSKASTSQHQQQQQQREQQQKDTHEYSDTLVQKRLSRIPPDIWSKLYPFQQQGVTFGVKHRGRFLLADEMGLGKTVQSLMVALCFAPEDWPLLIVCPSQMKLVWEQAVLDWVPDSTSWREGIIQVIKDKKSAADQLAASPKIVIVSYELAKDVAVLPHLHALKSNMIIADESHLMKNLFTKRTASIAKLIRASKRAILVSGTPALSRPIELYSQVDMLRPGLMGSVHDFGARYCEPTPCGRPEWSPYGNGMDYRGATNLAELQGILERTIMIRRMKDVLEHDLPPKVRNKIYIKMDPEKREDMECAKDELETISKLTQRGVVPLAELETRRKQLLTNLYYMTGPAKAPAVARYVRDILTQDPSKKVLVFAHHADAMDSLHSLIMGSSSTLGSNNTAFKGIRIDGSTTGPKRKKLVDQFQSDPSLRVALLSITAAGVGITLTAACHVIFAELYWNPGHLIQCEDRAHRMGQHAPEVRIDYLLSDERCSLDGMIWKSVGEKLDVVSSTMGDTGPNAFRTAGTLDRRVQLTSQRPQQQRSSSQAQPQAQSQSVLQGVKKEEDEEGVDEGTALAMLAYDTSTITKTKTTDAVVGVPTPTPKKRKSAQSINMNKVAIKSEEGHNDDGGGVVVKKKQPVKRKLELEEDPDFCPTEEEGSKRGGKKAKTAKATTTSSAQQQQQQRRTRGGRAKVDASTKFIDLTQSTSSESD